MPSLRVIKGENTIISTGGNGSPLIPSVPSSPVLPSSPQPQGNMVTMIAIGLAVVGLGYLLVKNT